MPPATKPATLPRRSSGEKFVWGLLGLAGLLLVGLIASRFFIQTFAISSHAMAPTLLGKTGPARQNNDHIWIEKFSARSRQPQRGDVVVFRTDHIPGVPSASRGQFWVKRVVGLPGERISLQPPQILINGQPVNDPPILARLQRSEDGYHGYVLPPAAALSPLLSAPSDSLQLGANEYFVLGDNSQHSFDSRFWGPLRGKAIVGRVIGIYWPIARAGRLP